jgi:transglutaminase-like putative cysteine protease
MIIEKKRLLHFGFLLIFLLMANTLLAQKRPMKFGKVDIEDLKMTVYDEDSTAEAVVLCDYGEFDPIRHQFTRHCRIKILKTSGTSQANVRVRVRAKSNVKARSYNLENGDVVVTKMKQESVFSETIKGRVYAIRFSIPNAKVGSVIEYSYYHDLIPYSWEFQRDIPTKWSELTMENTRYFTFNKRFIGYEPLVVNEKNRWVAKDMPAVRKEPYMNAIRNYASRFEFVISSFSIPGWSLENYNYSWEKIGNDLMDNEYFGGKITGNLFLKKIADQIQMKDTSELDKVKAAYELIKNKVTWDEWNSIYSFKMLQTVYSKGEGNSADINLMLISLLRKLDIEVHPVVVSTRENGILSYEFPDINKIDHVIAEVIVNGKKYLLDATDKYAPWGLLPKESINGKARILYKKTTRPITVLAPKASEKVSRCIVDFKEGNITGKISYQLKNYAAYDFRREIGKYSSQKDYINKLQENYSGLYISDYTISNVDDCYKPIVLDYNVELDEYIDVIGDKYYINPMLVEKIKENPFKNDERRYPVDYIHPIKDKYIMVLNIPDGYVVDKLPTTSKVTLPENKGSFTYHIANKGNVIQLTYLFNINDPILYSNEYAILKEFYDLLLNKQSEMIILKPKV